VAQDAQQAAQDAEDAAHKAQDSGNEQAAQAAQAAADAAKKAADSTRGQAAMVAQKALLSGDGASVAEAIGQCLGSPRYGLARNGSNVTTVYLYAPRARAHACPLFPCDPSLRVSLKLTPSFAPLFRLLGTGTAPRTTP
jgi:hypothetical protein